MKTKLLKTAEDRAFAIAKAASDIKALNIVICDVRGVAGFTDFLVLASGSSDRQVRAISDNIQRDLKELGERPNGVEGEQNAHWILVDYSDVVVHVFHQEERAFYQLEKLWSDAKLTEYRDEPVLKKASGAK